MKTLIIYASRHGCSERCARDVETLLNSPADVINIKKQRVKDLSGYQRIIIGGSIHAGRVQRKIKKLCERHQDILLTKNMGLYLCCMEEGETGQQQFDNAFPKALRDHATATAIFGGEFDFEKMNVIERAIIKKVAKVDHSISKIDQDKIKAFVKAMA